MSELLEISMETRKRIENYRLPGGRITMGRGLSCVYNQLIFFRQCNGSIGLYVELGVLAGEHTVVHREIIDVDKNPELFDLYDWDEAILVFDEVEQFFDGLYTAGSLSNFDEQPATTTISTHDS